MNKITRISRFIVPSIERIDKLNSERLFALCEYYSLTRRYRELDQTLRCLKTGGVVNPEALALYSVCNPATNNTKPALGLLYELSAEACPAIRARALTILAHKAYASGKIGRAFDLCLLGLKHTTINDPARYGLMNNLAVFSSIEGFHKEALSIVEKLIQPASILLDYLPDISLSIFNSLAVEFYEIGRLSEADDIIRFVLRSPIAGRYPEWGATGKDISDRKQKQRAMIYVPPSYEAIRNRSRMQQNQMSESEVEASPEQTNLIRLPMRDPRIEIVENLLKTPGQLLTFPTKSEEDPRIVFLHTLIFGNYDQTILGIINTLLHKPVDALTVSKIAALLHQEQGKMK